MSLARAMGSFLPQDILGRDGLLRDAAAWHFQPEPHLAMTRNRYMHAMGESVSVQPDPLYATVIDEDILVHGKFLNGRDAAAWDPSGREAGTMGFEEGGQAPGAAKWHPLHQSAGIEMKTCAPHLQRTRSLLMYSKCPASTYNDMGVLIFSDPNQVRSRAICYPPLECD